MNPLDKFREEAQEIVTMIFGNRPEAKDKEIVSFYVDALVSAFKQSVLDLIGPDEMVKEYKAARNQLRAEIRQKLEEEK